MSVKPIPDGFNVVTPYLILNDAAAAIEWYKKAFGATERFRLPGPNVTIGHAEIAIDGNVIMLADEGSGSTAPSAKTLGGSPVSFMVYVTEVDARFNQAVAAGARVLRTVKDQFYGDRTGTLEDPFGLAWTFGTHVEDVPDDELERRIGEHMPG